MTDNQTSEALIPAGWHEFQVASQFATALAPTYYCRDPWGLGFLANESHSNSNGVVHGGALATLADISLFMIAARGDDKMNGATLSLNLNYLRPGRIGSFIYCKGRVVREGSSVIFVEGSIMSGDDELNTFNGVIKRFKPRGA